MNELVARLKKAEVMLGIDLILRLQSDGSGAVSNWPELPPRDIFAFDTIRELDVWLEDPCVTSGLPPGVQGI